MIENGEPFLQKWNIGNFDLINLGLFADQHQKFVIFIRAERNRVTGRRERGS